MIKSLVVKGFKSIDNIKLDFNNLNLLLGVNSSGKSTIIQSLSPVGQRVYDTVFDNAIKYYEANNKSEIDKIVQNTDK